MFLQILLQCVWQGDTSSQVISVMLHYIMNWDKGIKIYSNTSHENSTLVQILSLVTTCKASKYSSWFWGFILAIHQKSFLCKSISCIMRKDEQLFLVNILNIFHDLKSRGSDVHSCTDHFFLPDPPYFLALHPFLFLSHLFQRRWSRVGFVSWSTT